ncbi:MAG TPA: SURF1 family protein [Kiloniellaceae bacterium]|nr:SURF1 family protein [Kiloniellaceae bacterium]
MTEPAASGQPKKRFRPTFWASLSTLIVLSALLTLGTWQLQRLAEKEALIADIAARTAGPPVALPQDVSDPTLAFQLVEVQGRYLPGKEQRLANRTHEGKVGVHLVAPFLLRDGRGLLVDRGWVPLAGETSASSVEAVPDGPQRLLGYLRFGGWHGWTAFRPDNAPAKGLFNWPDLAAMAAAADLPNAIDRVYLVLAPNTDAAVASFPIAQPPPVDLPNNHLQYAITWYALALVLLAIFIIYHWRPAELS